MAEVLVPVKEIVAEITVVLSGVSAELLRGQITQNPNQGGLTARNQIRDWNVSTQLLVKGTYHL